MVLAHPASSSSNCKLFSSTPRTLSVSFNFGTTLSIPLYVGLYSLLSASRPYKYCPAEVKLAFPDISTRRFEVVMMDTTVSVCGGVSFSSISVQLSLFSLAFLSYLRTFFTRSCMLSVFLSFSSRPICHIYHSTSSYHIPAMMSLRFLSRIFPASSMESPGWHPTRSIVKRPNSPDSR